jgi:hypothetical protein
MNIALEQTEEHVNGAVLNRYGDAFIRGNNGKSGFAFEQNRVDTLISHSAIHLSGGAAIVTFETKPKYIAIKSRIINTLSPHPTLSRYRERVVPTPEPPSASARETQSLDSNLTVLLLRPHVSLPSFLRRLP